MSTINIWFIITIKRKWTRGMQKCSTKDNKWIWIKSWEWHKVWWVWWVWWVWGECCTIFNLCLSINFPIHFISQMVHLIWWIDSLWTFKDVYSRNIKDHEYSEISLKSFNRCWVARGMVIITQFICAHHMREISTKHYCNSLFTKAKKKIVFHSKRQLQKLVSIHVVIHDRAFTFLLLPIILSAHILNFLNGINTFALCCWNFSYLRWNDCRLLFLHLLSSTAMNNKTTYKVLT